MPLPASVGQIQEAVIQVLLWPVVVGEACCHKVKSVDILEAFSPTVAFLLALSHHVAEQVMGPFSSMGVRSGSKDHEKTMMCDVYGYSHSSRSSFFSGQIES